jgi:hypothetical protein
MSKSRPKPKRPSLAPAALLRARLESQWHNPSAAQQPGEQLEAGLQSASQGHKPEVLLPAVLAVYAAARPEVQSALDAVLPGWLSRQGHLGPLTALAAKGHLPAPLQPIARRWLEQSGQDTQALVPKAGSRFAAAYEMDDGSQAAVSLMWYTDRHRHRATGMQFLIDYNPPWEGSVKDAFLFPRRPFHELEALVQDWEVPGQRMQAIEAGAAKRKIIQALLANRAANVRLPEDLVMLRDQFFEQILTLPDLPDTPAFTPDDFHALSQAGQPAEDLSRYEQTVGRRVRLEDGQEVFYDAATVEVLNAMEGDLGMLDDPGELLDEPGGGPGTVVPDLDDFDEDEA